VMPSAGTATTGGVPTKDINSGDRATGQVAGPEDQV
jgi:hypothetical protein